MIIHSQTVKQLVEIRSAFYELEAHLIPPELVFKHIVIELLKCGDERTKHSLLELAACYEHNMRLGSKRIYHFEAFVAKFMIIFKNNLMPPLDTIPDDDYYEDDMSYF